MATDAPIKPEFGGFEVVTREEMRNGDLTNGAPFPRIFARADDGQKFETFIDAMGRQIYFRWPPSDQFDYLIRLETKIDTVLTLLDATRLPHRRGDDSCTSLSVRIRHREDESDWKEFLEQHPEMTHGVKDEEAIPLPEFTDEDVLLALYEAILVRQHERREARERTCASSGEIHCALAMKAPAIPQGRYVDHGRIYASLRRLRAAGLLESGHIRDLRTVQWRFTRDGRSKIKTLGLTPEPGHLGRGLDAKPTLFLDEYEQAKKRWIAERQAARRRGEKAYARWFAKARTEDRDRDRIWFTDDEILDALAAASADGAVPFNVFYAALAPGKATAEEAARLSNVLVRMHKEGLIHREGKTGALRWTYAKDGTR